MKFLKRTLFALLVVGVVLGSVVFYRMNGWHLEQRSPDELFGLLEPYIEVQYPEGEGPFPTVIAFHGCGGVTTGGRDWMNIFNENGYATVYVDSMTPRESDWRLVCYGMTLMGSERAGDVMVVVDQIKQLDKIDGNRLAVMGWSHGAWSIMDSFTFQDQNDVPQGLLSAPKLEGVEAAILFYPYCAFPAKTSQPWEQQVPVQMHLAGKDTIVPTQACRDLHTIFSKKEYPIEVVEYPDVNHAFDLKQDDFKGANELVAREPERLQAVAHVLRFLNTTLR